MAAMKPTAKQIITFLREHEGEDVTAQMITDATGIPKRSVDGTFTSFTKEAKGWGYREEGEIENADGSHTKVKFLRLTDVGMSFDMDAVE